MKNEIGEFSVHRELLTRISNASSDRDVRRELSELPQEGQRFIDELRTLDESDWASLLRTLRENDSELSVIVRSAREMIKSVVEEPESDELFRLSSGIQAVFASSYLGIGNRVPYVRLIFKTADNETVYSDQDLEDALGIGTAVLQMVAESARSMVENLGIQPDRIVWGDEFEARLARAEEYTSTLRNLYNQHRRQEEDSYLSSKDS